MSKESICPSLAWGQFRFSIVGTLLARPPSKGELCKELENLARKHYLDPIKNEPVKFSFSTIERWYYKALNAKDPIKALSRKVRSDVDQTKVMTPQILSALERQYRRYSDWSYQLQSDNLTALILEKPDLGTAPSYSSVNRHMKKKGWHKKKSISVNQTQGQIQAKLRLEQREVRGFETEFPGALWHLDFHQGKRLADVNGEWHTPVCLCVLDDHSRLCCHIQWYLAESSQALYHGLCQAFHKRGLPRSLMTDNGGAMIAHETQNGLGRLGVLHETTLPYSPYQNGKQEKFWDQLEGRLMKMVSRVEPLTLEFLNHATQAWVEVEYNRSHHEEINEAPFERYIKGKDMSRVSPESKTFRFFFTLQEKRTQRQSDGTIKIKNIRFEVPSRLRTIRRLHVCYQSWDLSMVYLVDKKTGNLIAQVYPQDKTKNAEGNRRELDPIEEIPNELEVESEPHPPLLRKILTDYAATGLPPAYIPLAEQVPETSNKSKETKNEK